MSITGVTNYGIVNRKEYFPVVILLHSSYILDIFIKYFSSAFSECSRAFRDKLLQPQFWACANVRRKFVLAIHHIKLGGPFSIIFDKIKVQVSGRDTTHEVHSTKNTPCLCYDNHILSNNENIVSSSVESAAFHLHHFN